MKKFALCLLALCAALVPIGGLAVPCWAAESVTFPNGDYDTLQKAVEAAGKDGIVTLTDKVELDQPLDINESVTINGKGYTLTGPNNGPVILIRGGNKVEINNLTIIGGNNTNYVGKNNVETNGNGGGIYATSCGLTVKNCTFKSNTANGDGGGIYITSGGPHTVENCRFEKNKAKNGSSIYYEKTDCNIKRCTFYENEASEAGGVYVVYVRTDGNNSIENCTFANNKALEGRGVYVRGCATDIRYCTFVSGTDSANSESEIEYNIDNSGPTDLPVTNSIIYGNVSGFEPDETNNLTLDSAPTAASKKVKVGTDGEIIHTFFRVNEAVGRGTNAPELDQLGAIRAQAAPTIGAVAFDGEMTFTVTATKGLTPEKQAATSFSGYVGQAVTLSPDVTPAGLASGATWSISSGALPNGLSLNKETGVISGTPTVAAATPYSATVQAKVKGGDDFYTAKVNVKITIAAAPTVATPTFDPAAGTYDEAKSVTISCTTTGAAIYYTMNGSTPTASSTKYNGAISVKETTTLKAIAVKDGMTNSAVATAAYTINSGGSGGGGSSGGGSSVVATPTFSPAGGTYDEAKSVTISCTTTGAAIYYTTNGSTPTTSSTPYNGAITVKETTTINAIAVKTGMTNSAVAKATYTINSKPAERPTTADITGVKLSITTDTPTIKLKPGETATLKFTATATVTYKDGSTKTEPAKIYLWWMYDNLDWPEWLSITERGDGKATVTASPTEGVGGGTRTVHIAAKTQSACYNGNYDWTRCEFKVNVDVPETFTPGTLTFDKAHVEMTAAPGDTVEESVNVDFKLRGSGGTIKDDTEGEYAIKCQKIDGPDWVTASVAGQKVTFRATAPKTGGTSSTSIFNVYVQDKDGKQYLKTSYRVVANVAKLKSYQITVAPAEITGLDTNLNEVAMDLNPYVRLEKLYDNGTRKAVDDFKLEFTPPEKDGTTPNWLDFRENGWVRIDPRFSKEVGEYLYTYKVTATTPDGQTKTGTGALTVNIVSKGAPVITTETLPDAEAYAAYTTNLDATGTGSITWEVTSGKLPTGMLLNKETGKISGTAKIEPRDFTFTVKATNYAGPVKREFTIKVVDQKIKVGDQKVPWKTSYTTSVKKTSSSSKGTWKVKFNVKNGTNVKYEDASDKGNLDKNHFKEVVVTKGGKVGDGLIQYTLYWPYDKNTKKGNAYTYNFKVQASNTTGKSTLTKSYIVDEDGNVGKPDDTASVTVASGPVAILTGDGDDGEETFEPYKDGSAPKDEAFSEGKTYFTNGSMDENGYLYVVIGKAVEGDDEGKKYVFDSVTDIPEASRDKVVSVGFRSGSNFDADATVIRSLHNLSDLSIDENDVIDLDLSEMRGLTSLSLYGCGVLTSLNVRDCNNLASLSVMECPALSTLNVMGCGALEDVEVTDAAITTLDLSNRSKLTTLSANGCGMLETLNLAGSYALTDVSLDSTDISALDLSACAGLKSLSLADVTKLETLTLPTDVKFDSFTLTESRVGGALTVNGTEQLTTLNLSGNAGLTGLDLSGCPELKMLDVSGCEFEILDLSQCTALEKLNASECAWMTTLTLPNGGTQDASVSAQGSAVSATAGKLKELSVGGCAELRSLNVSGMSLGHLELDGLKWLLSVQSDGQFIGNVDLSQSMNLKEFAGNCLYRVSDVQGYAADGSPVKTEFNKDTGVVTFASQPYDMSYVYDTGLYGYVLGVTVSPASDPADGPDSPTSNRGGGGCDAGLGLAGLLALTALLFTKKRW